ncbi:MAG TPA: protein kinase [Thermoanaerobaculia bacterium]|nr:protein kinase [Thermoanaerobaculia bacterium]
MTETAGETRQNFGHYDVESVLGRGAMGMVYLARDKRIGRKVALKTVHVNEKFDDESEANEFYKRLQREAELCGALQHPNIVTLYEPGYENNVIAWLATEYVDGENLRDHMRKRKPLPLDEALRIVEGIMRGLAYAHAKGIVHRDIKPANILLTSTGEAKIADFGIARPLDSTLTAVGEMLGTPSYMSPEQVRCQPVTTRSDLFSVGAVLYEMLTGIKAFGASDVTGILRNVVETTPKAAHEVNAAVPPPLSGFLDRLYAKKPDDRFPSAVEALDELQRIRQEIGPAEAAAAAAPEAVEEVDDAHSTLAVTPRASEMGTVPPSVTQPDYDMTPALGARTSVWRRALPAPLFWAVIIAALAMFTGTVLAIGSKIDSRPVYTYPTAQLRVFEAKKAQLRSARALVLAGKFEDGIAAYNAYIAKYPNSPAARAELANAEAALAKANESKAKVTVTEAKQTSTKKKEPEKKPSLLQRLFHRGDSKPQPKTPPKKKP